MTHGQGHLPDPMTLGAAANPWGEYAVPVPVARPLDPVAVAALVTALLCLAPVGLVLGVLALRRTRGDATYGRPLAVLAVAASVIVLVVAPLGWVLGSWTSDRFPGARDVEVGDCVDISRADAFIERGCDRAHHGEVAAAGELDADAARRFTDADAAHFCAPLLEGSYRRAARSGGYAVGAVVQVGLSERDPRAGDRYACYLSDIDGDELTDPIATTREAAR